MASGNMTVDFSFVGEDEGPDDLQICHWQGPIPAVGQRVVVGTTPDLQWSSTPSMRAGVVERITWDVLPWSQHVTIVLRPE